MLKVGLTGNIGSGKTTVSRIFEVIGIPVFHADAEAKKLYFKEEVKEKVLRAFGSAVFTNGNVDFKKLAQLIFSDSQHLTTINNIIHPLVFKSFNIWLESKSYQPYVLHEAAIIFENDLQSRFDAIINVSADPEARLQRVVDRDGSDKESVNKRINNQMSDFRKSELSNYVIYNNYDDMLIPQVLKVHKELIKKTKACVI